MLKRRSTEQDEALPNRPVPPPEPSRRRRRSRPGRRIRVVFLRSVGIAAIVLAIVYLSLPFLLNADRLRPRVEAEFSRSLGRAVHIGELRFAMTLGGLVATDISIADDPAFSPAPFFHARRVDLTVRRLPLLFRGAVEVRGISMVEPSVTLIRNGDRWNYYSMLTAEPSRSGSAGPRARITGGVLTLRTSDGNDPFVLRDLDLDVPHFSTAFDNVFTLSARVDGGGTVKANGKIGPATLDRGLLVVPMSLLINAKKVGMAESHLTTSLSPSLGGLLSLDGTVESDGKTVHVNGNLEVDELRLASHGAGADNPLLFIFTLQYDLVSRSGLLTHCDIPLEKGAAGITGKFAEADGKTNVSFEISGRGVPLAPLGGILPAMGIPLPSGTHFQGGVGFVDLLVLGPLDRPVTTGTISVNNTRLLGFDLERRLSLVEGLDMLNINPDLAINAWSAKVNRGPNGLMLEGINVVLPEIGTMSGAGSIRENRTLDFRMEVNRSGVADQRPIPFEIHGSSSGPVFRRPGKSD